MYSTPHIHLHHRVNILTGSKGKEVGLVSFSSQQFLDIVSHSSVPSDNHVFP